MFFLPFFLSGHYTPVRTRAGISLANFSCMSNEHANLRVTCLSGHQSLSPTSFSTTILFSHLKKAFSPRTTCAERPADENKETDPTTPAVAELSDRRVGKKPGGRKKKNREKNENSLVNFYDVAADVDADADDYDSSFHAFTSDWNRNFQLYGTRKEPSETQSERVYVKFLSRTICPAKSIHNVE